MSGLVSDLLDLRGGSLQQLGPASGGHDLLHRLLDPVGAVRVVDVRVGDDQREPDDWAHESSLLRIGDDSVSELAGRPRRGFLHCRETMRRARR
jgi:hypothetical protein